jgi:hypothetical protein
VVLTGIPVLLINKLFIMNSTHLEKFDEARHKEANTLYCPHCSEDLGTIDSNFQWVTCTECDTEIHNPAGQIDPDTGWNGKEIVEIPAKETEEEPKPFTSRRSRRGPSTRRYFPRGPFTYDERPELPTGRIRLHHCNEEGTPISFTKSKGEYYLKIRTSDGRYRYGIHPGGYTEL